MATLVEHGLRKELVPPTALVPSVALEARVAQRHCKAVTWSGGSSIITTLGEKIDNVSRIACTCLSLFI
jgi:hypothetical protein